MEEPAGAAALADGDLHIVDESGEDYLYPATAFVGINLPGKSCLTAFARSRLVDA